MKTIVLIFSLFIVLLSSCYNNTNNNSEEATYPSNLTELGRIRTYGGIYSFKYDSSEYIIVYNGDASSIVKHK